ncbi:MAG TPA: CBS domain-containing protein [Phaeodactylibacter sp.]|nr:CBS domain-containing protein [Phaeodactylibacter sp.]
MNTLAPVSEIMTSDLITVNPEDKLEQVQEIFNKHRIHHVPVVRYKEIVGMISKSDVLYFLRGLTNNSYEKVLNDVRLKNYTAKDIMTKGIAKLSSKDRIAVALEIFKENLFHAIPVVDDGELVGILTTYDIIKKLTERKTNT